MADLIKTPIMRMDPVGSEDANAEWIVESKPADGGLGRVTVRKKYPSGGDGITIDTDGVVEVDVDDDTIKIGSDGKLYSTASRIYSAYAKSKVVSNVTLATSAAPSAAANKLNVEIETGNDMISAAGGVATVSGKVTWVSVSVLATIECPTHEDNLYMVPVVISVNDEKRTYVVDTTESTTVINHQFALYNAGQGDMPVTVYAYKDSSDADSSIVPMKISYRVIYTGV